MSCTSHSSIATTTHSIPVATAALPILHLTSNETVPFSTLYTPPPPPPPATQPSQRSPQQPAGPTVTIFLRRWGCQLCRGYAHKLSTTLLPLLNYNNVRLVAIGFEGPGADQWTDGRYFPASELYVDNGRKIYTALGVKRPNVLSGFMKLLSSSTRAWNNEVKAMGITGNMAGDGMQLGATFIISPTGELWMERRQQDYGDHPTAAEIVSALRANMKGWKELPGTGVDGGKVLDGVAEETVREDESVKIEANTGTTPPSGVKVLEKFGTGANTCNEDCF